MSLAQMLVRLVLWDLRPPWAAIPQTTVFVQTATLTSTAYAENKSTALLVTQVNTTSPPRVLYALTFR